ncbi:mitotic spindle assembly checkpoint protein MAD2A [Biomphalaria glabrata]|uniref:Mitotic spindle assembly checkpoint protein MAD2A n=2 Tax=Biomphalaria TaxID=6525 RepID=A0A2C9JRZ5_BIOGL|nr:mitotic spindle assembly checkpoint protein MAD2A-like [Biomphalaria glabrata]KAI8764749.1 mitotic spindle assembly checkpoint protein MAD2A-like [Biomphalaria glabrata]KAI8796653.1 mitotic spindle assembly checkpoint protein MAD2A [Biomphalaria glabrata]KAK0056501.1 mitotic spindle assembly checkpoint protein MAD2A [Biomphalaria pfeifferi]
MATATSNVITLKGSTEIVAEFFHYGLNSILYQRGLYPPETFTHTQQWGLTMLVTCDKDLQAFLQQIISQVKAWLTEKTIAKLVVVIKEIATNEVVERWQFDIQCDKSVTNETKREASDKDIKDGIRSVIRQITASVTFLPLLESACCFDILVYTDKDLEVPEQWGETGPHLIYNSEEVRLKSFSTSIHTVKAAVAFKKMT